MKGVLLTGLVFSIMFLDQTHEFWLQPKKYRYHLGEQVMIDFMVGDAFTGEFWDLNRNKPVRAELHRVSGSSELKRDIIIRKGNNLSLKADQEGTYLVAFQSNSAFIEMGSEAFNEYLKEDGLEDILNERKKLNQLDKDSKEYYTRFAKLLVQVGDNKDDTFKKVIGFQYEIIPVQNPYRLKTGDYLQCQVFFEGKPASHSLVKVWSKIENTTFLQNIYTEKDGTIRFPISTRGEWMVSSVKMIKSEMENADYHSLWASLVFGI